MHQVIPQQVTYIQKTRFALWTDVTHSILVTIRAVITPVVVSTINLHVSRMLCANSSVLLECNDSACNRILIITGGTFGIKTYGDLLAKQEHATPILFLQPPAVKRLTASIVLVTRTYSCEIVKCGYL